VLAEELRVCQDELLRLFVLLVDGGVLHQQRTILLEERLVPIRERRLVGRRHLQLLVLALHGVGRLRGGALLVLGHELVGANVAHVKLLRALHPRDLLLRRLRVVGLQLLALLLLLRLALLPLLALQPDHQVVVNVGVEVVLIVRQLDAVPLRVVGE
jgi:hypothetical protein